MDNEGCLKILQAAAIWLGAPIFFSFTMPIISGCDGLLISIINFFVGGITIFASAIAISGISFFKSIIGLFRRTKKDSELNPEKEIPKSFGISAILISIIVFLLAGIIASLVSLKSLKFNPILIYTFAGMLWGYIVYLLFQKGIFEPDEF